MWLRYTAVTLFVMGIFAGQAPAAATQDVDKAIVSGIKYIYSRQDADGTWEKAYSSDGFNDQTGGLTSMALYTLLTAGEKETDPKLANAVKFVIKLDTPGTYALSFQALALSKLTQTPEVQASIKRVAATLIKGGERKGGTNGMWRYLLDDVPRSWDHSAAQYAALGLWACGECNLELPDSIWQEIDHAWRTQQKNDGAWNYNDLASPPAPPKLPMTVAGVATLFITDEELSWQKQGDCKGNPNDATIERGLKWTIAHIADHKNAYTWYGLERIGIASGYKYFGSFDWYKEGSDDLVKRQEADGSVPYDYGPEAGTCYAVLFLVRGRAPVMMNKLHYEKDPTIANPVDGAWNQRPLDAAGAAKFGAAQLESFLNWQVVNLENDPDEMHDAPILYIAGYEPLKFTPDQEAKLRKFIEDGGMILGNADCASASFANTFKTVCEKLVDKKYEFRTLPATHTIFTHEQFPSTKWHPAPAVQGMSNGVRELALLVPAADLAKAWQMRETKTHPEQYQLIDDIYLYATDRQGINEKGITWIVRPDADAKPDKTIKVARLQYKGNWDPEPGGWRRLSAIFANTKKITLTVEPFNLGTANLSGYQVAHLTGTDKFELDDAGRIEIKQFIEAGGTLIIDAAGGSTAFADAAAKELTTIFPDAAAQLKTPLPISSPIFGGMKLEDFKVRSILRGTERAATLPTITAITINNRPAVLFSREDLSAGLVGENVDGVLGYTPETATMLMANLIAGSEAKK